MNSGYSDDMTDWARSHPLLCNTIKWIVFFFAPAKWCGFFFYPNQARRLVFIVAVGNLSATSNTRPSAISKECCNIYFRFCCFRVSCLLLLTLACCTFICSVLSYLPGLPPPGWAGHGQESASPPTKGGGTSVPTLLPSQQGTLPAEWSVPVEKYDMVQDFKSNSMLM